MFARLALGSAALLLVGCADMLGLGGLTYDQGRTEAELVGATEPVEPQDGLGLGGSGQVRPIESDYPMMWPEGSIIVQLPASARSSLYWVYDPGAQVVTTYTLNLYGPDFISEKSWESEVSFTHVVASMTDEGPLLTGYDSETGWTERAKGVLNDEPLVSEASRGSKERTHLLVATDGEADRLVAYDAMTGNMRVLSGDSSLESQAFSGDWELGLEEIQAFSWQGAFGVLTWKGSQLTFQSFADDRSSFETLFHLSIEEQIHAFDDPPSLFRVLPSAEGELLCFYDALSGRAMIYRVRAGSPDNLLSPELELIGEGDDFSMFSGVDFLPEGMTDLRGYPGYPEQLLAFDGLTADLLGPDDEEFVIVK